MTSTPHETGTATGGTSPSATTDASGPIATFGCVVLDTPEPRRLAEFYSAILGYPIVRDDDDWVAIKGESGPEIAFQLAPDFAPPTWPDNAVPQQFHLDVDVPDLDAAERRVLAIGARPTGEPKPPSTFRAYLDPSGHPFCLCLAGA
jgi:catechol 2,3-dioxygenase-like lactoylglutathione lyase family enzyme